MDAQFRLPEEAPPARPGREEHTLPSELRSFQEVFQQVQAALMPRYASLFNSCAGDSDMLSRDCYLVRPWFCTF